MYPVYFSILAVIVGCLQIFFLKTPPFSAFLIAFIFCTIGLQGLFAFCGHFFTPDQVAEGIGWPKGNPFQTEIAFTNLSYGILGILAIWLQGDFWLATIIGKAIFVWGAGYVHIIDLKKSKNISPLNAGPVLYFDLLLPLIYFGLYSGMVLS